ncbi:hypothetical protein Sjap_017788 [Stephania japonica]|uniref:RNase H type-1 domain-containing protein n=1 Tax=Stephania japonica TaxID=461633 RepID=A0AAP0I6Z6_9MAGN
MHAENLCNAVAAWCGAILVSETTWRHVTRMAPLQKAPFVPWRQNSWETGIGWILASRMGFIKRAGSFIVGASSSIEVAEAMAIRNPAQHCRDCSDPRMICFDAKIVVEALNSHDKEYGDLDPILFDVRNVSKNWDPFNYHFVPRELNVKAYSLARKALFERSNCLWENPPHDVFVISRYITYLYEKNENLASINSHGVTCDVQN